MTQPPPPLRHLADELRNLQRVEEQANKLQDALHRVSPVLVPGRTLTADEAFIAACDLQAGMNHLMAGLSYLSAAYASARRQVPDGLLGAVVVIDPEPTEETHP